MSTDQRFVKITQHIPSIDKASHVELSARKGVIHTYRRYICCTVAKAWVVAGIWKLFDYEGTYLNRTGFQLEIRAKDIDENETEYENEIEI